MTTWAPRPVLCTSRIRPPVPVVAPGKGATPVGKLCVSAVKQMSRTEERTVKEEGSLGSEDCSTGTSAPGENDRQSQTEGPIKKGSTVAFYLSQGSYFSESFVNFDLKIRCYDFSGNSSISILKNQML